MIIILRKGLSAHAIHKDGSLAAVSLNLSAPPATINSILGDVTFQGHRDYSGELTIHVAADDRGSFGVGDERDLTGLYC